MEEFQPTKGIEWVTTIVSADDTPDLADAEARLFIPGDDARIRGVLVFSRVGLGNTEYEQDAWRDAAAAQGLALVNVEFPELEEHALPFTVPVQSAAHLSRALFILSMLSNHPELDTAPLFFFGHSNGAHWITRMLPLLAARTIGFIAFNGGLTCDGLYSPEVLSIPGLFHLTEYDPVWLRDSSISIVEEGVYNGALWALYIQPDAGHWDVDPSRAFLISFMNIVVEGRLPAPSASEEPEPLRPFPLDDVRLGQLAHHSVYDGEEEFEGSGREVITDAALLPAGTPLDTPGTLYRLVSSDFAEKWLFGELYGMEPSPSE